MEGMREGRPAPRQREWRQDAATLLYGGLSMAQRLAEVLL
jgi:hypothetical protein